MITAVFLSSSVFTPLQRLFTILGWSFVYFVLSAHLFVESFENKIFLLDLFLSIFFNWFVVRLLISKRYAPQEGTQALYFKPGQEFIVEKVISPTGDCTITILLNRHGNKLPSKYFIFKNLD